MSRFQPSGNELLVDLLAELLGVTVRSGLQVGQAHCAAVLVGQADKDDIVLLDLDLRHDVERHIVAGRQVIEGL